MQLIQDDDDACLFYIFTRWGRVGYSGGAARQKLCKHHSAEEGILL